MQDVKLMTSRDLLTQLYLLMAKLDAVDSDLIDSAYETQLNRLVSPLRTEILTRMGSGKIEPSDESLLQDLLTAVVKSVNSGEEEPPESRSQRDELIAQVLSRADGDSVLQIA